MKSPRSKGVTCFKSFTPFVVQEWTTKGDVISGVISTNTALHLQMLTLRQLINLLLQA